MGVDLAYKGLLLDILDNGEESDDRTGVGTISTFGQQIELDLREGFPLLSLKSTFFKGVIYELLWFISGSTNIKPLQANGVHIWDSWANEAGELGPVYGKQWRDSGGVDQLQSCINSLIVDKESRRMVVDSWVPELLPDGTLTFSENVAQGKQALPPCHYSYQFYSSGGYLDLKWQQRSVDVFLGLPFNIASYAALVEVVAKLTRLKPRKLIGSFGDTHIYNNHMPHINELFSRTCSKMPELEVGVLGSIDDYKYHDFNLLGYSPHPAISAEVAV